MKKKYFIGLNLRKLAEVWQLQHKELAKLIGTDKNNFSGYSQGRVMPPVDVILKIHEITGIPIYNFIKTDIPVSAIPGSPIELDQRDAINIVSDPTEVYKKSPNKKVEEKDLNILSLLLRIEDLEKSMLKLNHRVAEIEDDTHKSS